MVMIRGSSGPRRTVQTRLEPALLLGLAAVCGLGSKGCQDPGAVAVPSVTTTDSAGIDIAVAQPLPGLVPTFEAAASPQLSVGLEAGPETYLLHDVQGAIRLSNGEIVIVNAGSFELRYFAEKVPPSELQVARVMVLVSFDFRASCRGSLPTQCLCLTTEFSGSVSSTPPASS